MVSQKSLTARPADLGECLSATPWKAKFQLGSSVGSARTATTEDVQLKSTPGDARFKSQFVRWSRTVLAPRRDRA
jgi:hypothetical protein